MHINDQYVWNAFFSLLFASFVLSGGMILEAFNALPQNVPTLMEFFILTLAALRITRLFVYDKITSFFRDQFYDVVEKRGKCTLEKPDNGPRRTIADLLSCPWCVGMWSGATVVFFYYLTSYALYPILFCAIAGAASMLQIFSNMVGWKAEQLKDEVEG